MPRRNNRFKPAVRSYYEPPEPQRTTDQLARDLVIQGKTPQTILGPLPPSWRPITTTEGGREPFRFQRRDLDAHLPGADHLHIPVFTLERLDNDEAR